MAEQHIDQEEQNDRDQAHLLTKEINKGLNVQQVGSVVHTDKFRFDPVQRAMLVKTERFDHEKLEQLRKDTQTFPDVGKIIKQYHDCAEKQTDTVSVVYQFGKRAVANPINNLILGRRYPSTVRTPSQRRAKTLCSMPSIYRKILAQKYYFEVDISNAHYAIAVKLCNDFKISCECIKEYVKNREEYIKKFGTDFKIEFLKILYGGYYNVKYEEEIEGDGSKERNDDRENIAPLLDGIQEEITALNNMIYSRHDLFKQLKVIVNEHDKDIRPSILSLLLTTEETRIMDLVDQYLSFKGRSMDVRIHDGGLVAKLRNGLETEEEFRATNIVKELEEQVKLWLGFDVEMKIKSLEHNWTPKVVQIENSYEEVKERFELKHCQVDNFVLRETDDRGIKVIAWRDEQCFTDVFNMYSEKEGRVVEVPFYPVWRKDMKRRKYERMDFVMDKSKCPPDTYNLFKGFEADKYDEYDEEIKNMPSKQFNTLIKPFLKLLSHLGGEVPEFGEENEIAMTERLSYNLNYLATLIQKPGTRTEMCVVFRDIKKQTEAPPEPLPNQEPKPVSETKPKALPIPVLKPLPVFSSGLKSKGFSFKDKERVIPDDNQEGGNGKSLFFNKFGSKILGKDLYLCIDNNPSLHSEYTAFLVGKNLVFLEEMDQSNTQGSNAAALRAKITAETLLINEKHKSQRTTLNYINLIGGTNNRYPLKYDRRACAYDVDNSIRKEKGFFTNFVNCYDNPIFVRAVFLFLMYYEIEIKNPNDFSLCVPMTPALLDLKRFSQPLFRKWLECIYREGGICKHPVSRAVLLDNFKRFVGGKNQDITSYSFNNDIRPYVVDHHSSHSRTVSFRFDLIDKDLRAWDLIYPTDVYVHNPDYFSV